LDGLYFITVGDLKNAEVKMNRIVQKAGSTLDQSSQLYNYPNIQENYHMALARILCEKLRDITSD
jgi:hypothetical protein